MKFAWLALSLGLLPLTAPAAAPPPSVLAARIHTLLSRSSLSATSFWGIEIADSVSGESIFTSNGDHFFVPASNTKLFTAALTLSRLGPAFRLRTTLSSSQQPDSRGVLAGDLVLNGAGDPSLKTSDVEFLAERIYQRGIRTIDGAIIGDDTAFLWEPYSPGWSIEDPLQGDGAPVSALTVNDNAINLHVTPKTLAFDPPVPLFQVENQVEENPTVPTAIHLERLPGSTSLRLWGTIQPDAKDVVINLAVDDPARYAAAMLFDALLRHGIEITGKPQARHRRPGERFPPPVAPVVLAVHESAPLIEDLRLTEKSSQNLHAETYLHLVALQRLGLGSRAEGLNDLRAFLRKAKVDKSEYTFFDGSGLSRLNVVTPHAITALLLYMAKSPVREEWFSLLPVSGVDGTLERRMKGSKIRGRIAAKTGSLSHVSALSGYATRPNGKQYAFSILVNNYNAPAAEVRDLIDKLCSLLVE